MICVTDKKECCGCAACAQACPKQSIAMSEDREGFLYPQVDAQTCIHCGLCEKVCHELHPYPEQRPQQVYAAVNTDEAVRMKSSSGGLFHLLASQTIAEGGVVFGARFDDEWQVVIDYTETSEGISAFMGSKYVQARTATAFTDARRFLQDGRKVLFSGTPCQIAALRHFLRKDYDNLLAVDFICHGTPSPKLWRKYLAELLCGGRRATHISFRHKGRGWKNFHFKLDYVAEDGAAASHLTPFADDLYMKAFLHDLTLRPSCYACKAKAGRSHSDLTLADFWGVDTLFPDMDDDKGTGMVFVHTPKGAAALPLSKLCFRSADYEAVKPLNPSCYLSVKEHPRRSEFFARLNGRRSVSGLLKRFTQPSRKALLRAWLGRCKRKLLNILPH